MKENQLIQFLSAYGPASNGNNMYDEFVVEASKKAGIEPLKIPENYSEKIAQNLLSDTAISVILTGTAGDGKTYTARQVLNRINQKFNKIEVWSNTESVFTVTLEDRTITFIKDMSEMSAQQKQEIVPKMIKSFEERNRQDLYLICVNDGQLLKIWRDFSHKDLLNSTQDLLRDDLEETIKYHFKLINMSRRSHAQTLDQMIDTIASHPAWSQCEGCPAKVNDECPILKNLNELKLKGEATLRERLKSLLLISAANEEHLSIRQLLILIVNILLGDTENSDNPILNCNRALKRYRDQKNERKTAKKINPFDNAFGENLQVSKRLQYTVFSTLARFGIGFETSKYFEREIFENDLLNTNRNAIDIKSIRRELFFKSIYSQELDKSPWFLTRYQYADLYLKALSSIPQNNDLEIIKQKIIKGLNRILNQSMTNTQDALWLTENANIHQGISYLTLRVSEPIPIKRKKFGLFIELINSNKSAQPLNFNIMLTIKDKIFSFEINPELFDYILRVSNGLLLNGTSNDKLQDVKSFQIRCAGEIKRFFEEEGLDFAYSVAQVDEQCLMSEEEILILK